MTRWNWSRFFKAALFPPSIALVGYVFLRTWQGWRGPHDVPMYLFCIAGAVWLISLASWDVDAVD